MEPTHYCSGETPHILDLVFTNEQTMINEVHCLGCSDHVCLSFKFMCYSLHASSNNRPKYNFYHADFKKMCELLSNIDWYSNLTSLSIQKAWKFFILHFNETLGQCIPLTKQHKKKNVYMSSDARHLRNRRNKLWKKYLISKSVDDFRRYSMVRKH